MATLSSLTGVPVVLPNYEPPTLVTMVNSLTTNVTTVAKRSIAFNIAEYDVNVAFSGTNTQGALQLTLPSGDVVDDSLLAVPANIVQNSILCNVTVADATGISRYRGRVFINSTTTVRVYIDELIPVTLGTAAPGYSNTIDSSANRPVTFANGDFVTIRFSVPLVRLAGGYTAYGAGFATGSRPGLVQQTPETNIAANVTSAQGGFAVSSAVAIAKADVSGAWRIEANISVTFSSASISLLTFAISGTTFTTVQAVSCTPGGTVAASKAYTGSGTGNVTLECTATTMTNAQFTIIARVSSKPSWA